MKAFSVPSIISLCGFIVICLAAGGVGAALTTSEIGGWYQTIVKPSWNPPAWIFGPVWTTLYILMGIAAWLVWLRSDNRQVRLPLIWFAIQLVLNFAWSPVFFRMHAMGLAFAVLVALWIAIATTMYLFFQRSTVAGLLLVPYLVWVSFAGVLNFTLWQLNS